MQSKADVNLWVNYELHIDYQTVNAIYIPEVDNTQKQNKAIELSVLYYAHVLLGKWQKY